MPIRIEHVNYIYNEGTSFEKKALDDICLRIEDGQFIGLIGHTGSGKSTLVQHLNGLLRATSGRIFFGEQDIYADGFRMKELRRRVGLVFQYPEYQLFEAEVLTDVCFGPKNLGLSEDEAKEKARQALEAVGIGEESFARSPFDLSGGQKRRVAIAGILAMEPEVLVLDEPTAGLDPRGRDEILGLLEQLHRERHITVILVSHSMEDVANYADRIVVMDRGKVLLDDVPANVFVRTEVLEQAGLAAPSVTYIMQALRQAGWSVNTSVTTIDEARDEILDCLGLGWEARYARPARRQDWSPIRRQSDKH